MPDIWTTVPIFGLAIVLLVWRLLGIDKGDDYAWLMFFITGAAIVLFNVVF
jgi:hypothetical protein